MTSAVDEVAARGADGDAALTIRNLSKAFGGTRALAGVDLDILPGEVHGLVGQNGSGKSTLIKVLSGYHTPEVGAQIEVAGEGVALPLSAGQIQRLGLRFVHQDLALSPVLSVVENLFVDEVTTRHRWLIRWGRERDRAGEVFEPFGRQIDPRARVGDLAAADQAHVAIVRAVAQLRGRRSKENWAPGLLVLDEATAFLPREGKEQLFALIREIVQQGDSVLFVSHYIDEVLEVTDRVSVLRDGRLVTTAPTAELDSAALVGLIIGRALAAQAAPAADRTTARAVVEVSGLSGSLTADVDLAVHEGEVVGVSGLLGSGFEEVPGLLFGAARAAAGRLRLHDDEMDLKAMTPRRATRAGIALVPENRDRDGGAAGLTVAENVTLQILHRYLAGPRALRRLRMLRDAETILDRFDIRPRDPHARLADLSGGNQQKVVMAKWLTAEPRLLLLHEPTHGVDVGSRAEILARIRQAAREGTAVLCASSDPEQLADLCDRVLVFGRGRVRSELVGSQVHKDRIIEHCYSAAAA